MRGDRDSDPFRMCELMSSSEDPFLATGDELDDFGELLGVDRNGDYDDEYRERLEESI